MDVGYGSCYVPIECIVAPVPNVVVVVIKLPQVHGLQPNSHHVPNVGVHCVNVAPNPTHIVQFLVQQPSCEEDIMGDLPIPLWLTFLLYKFLMIYLMWLKVMIMKLPNNLMCPQHHLQWLGEEE